MSNLGTNKETVELIFVRGDVWLHPSSSKKDNVKGFLSLSKQLGSSNTDILLSFTPEGQVSSNDIEKYHQVIKEGFKLERYVGNSKGANNSTQEIKNKRLVKKPSNSSAFSYQFSLSLSFVYSIQVRKPSLGLWNGSFIIFNKSGDKMPIVFFHDSEDTSQHFRQTDTGEWGGEIFMNSLKALIHVQESSLVPGVFLVNPDSADLRNFAPYKPASSQEVPKSSESFILPDINKAINTAKWKVLEAVATFTARSKNQVLDIMEERAPSTVKQVLSIPEVKRIGNDFEGARVYLAKWAQQVKHEAEVSRKKFMLDDSVYNKINKELGSNEYLTDAEINRTSRRREISKSEWESFFDHSGRLLITVNEVKDRIFHGGLEESIRSEAWLFLFGVYPWTSSREEREILKRSYETSYQELKMKWIDNEERRSSDSWKDQKHRIEKDIRRTDRQIPLFRSKRHAPNYSSNRESSPETPDEDEEIEEYDEDDDISNISNPHLFAMREILLTYNEYNKLLGYVQGMTDLLSPLYVEIRDETLTFWAFTNFMERMERNFVKDQSGMKAQMGTLNSLLQFMLPNLFKHLEKCETIDLFFFFRMLLVWFKREFKWNDVLRLWEIFCTDFYSSQFHLFFALAILSDNERIIIQNLRRFDEILKYMNDLSMKMEIDPLLIRSELLFLKFERMISIIDRENGKRLLNANPYDDKPEQSVIEIGQELRQLLSKQIVVQKETESYEEGERG